MNVNREYSRSDNFYPQRNVNVHPEKHYWCGFDDSGRQKWYIKLSNGRIVGDKDENYFFWLKKYTTNERQIPVQNF